MKKSLLLVLVTFVVLAFAASGVSAKNLKAAMVTDVGGLGDQSFNDAAWRGLLMAQEQLGMDIAVVESGMMNDYEPNLMSLVQQDYDLIWAIGFLMTDALNNVAEMYPDYNFGIIDAVVDQPNVLSVTYKEHEGSFLAGVLAALWSKTGKIGFVGGMDTPLIQKFEAGYVAGVKAVRPDAEVLVAYTGAFDDPGKGKELAMTQFSQGADIIYHASGACGLGVIEAAKEMGRYAIGVDSDQSHLAPKNVVASMIKLVDVGVFTGAEALSEGKFEGGHIELGLAEDGVGLAFSPELEIPKEITDTLDSYRKAILSGELVVPSVPKR